MKVNAGETIKYGNSLYKVVQSGSDPIFDVAKYQFILNNTEIWIPSRMWKKDATVIYSGSLYQRLSDSTVIEDLFLSSFFKRLGDSGGGAGSSDTIMMENEDGIEPGKLVVDVIKQELRFKIS